MRLYYNFTLVFMLSFSFLACVTKSSAPDENAVPAAEMKNYTGGIYVGAAQQDDEGGQYDEYGNWLDAKQAESMLKIEDSYRVAYVDTTLLVKAQELLSIKVIGEKDSEAVRKVYAAGLVEIELTEQGRVQLMNLTMANSGKIMYLILDEKILAELNIEAILAAPVVQLRINDNGQLEDTKAFFAKKN
jgi:hypothetical protein